MSCEARRCRLAMIGSGSRQRGRRCPFTYLECCSGLVVVVEPVEHRLVLVLVQLHLDRLERLDVEEVVAVVERRLLVVERGKRMRLKWRRSRFSRRIMIHIVPHCARYTGSITLAPVMCVPRSHDELEHRVRDKLAPVMCRRGPSRSCARAARNVRGRGWDRER